MGVVSSWPTLGSVCHLTTRWHNHEYRLGKGRCGYGKTLTLQRNSFSKDTRMGTPVCSAHRESRHNLISKELVLLVCYSCETDARMHLQLFCPLFFLLIWISFSTLQTRKHTQSSLRQEEVWRHDLTSEKGFTSEIKEERHSEIKGINNHVLHL